jgi:hypothetical protein
MRVQYLSLVGLVSISITILYELYRKLIQSIEMIRRVRVHVTMDIEHLQVLENGVFKLCLLPNVN